jgi:hypothetical protein
MSPISSLHGTRVPSSLELCCILPASSPERCSPCPSMPSPVAYQPYSSHPQWANTSTRPIVFRLLDFPLVSIIARHLWKIDSSPVLQRLVVAGSCVLFYVLAIRLKMPRGSKEGLLALLAIFGCVEKLCAIMNLVSVERDWVCWPFTCSLEW